ncbi:MAG: hypothetical protein C0613_09055 [Desulfobulbaceae bacterium]|nr:MAG: hypothetical protein C0613_09055 [Desulfobulbaceae bacterium]
MALLPDLCVATENKKRLTYAQYAAAQGHPECRRLPCLFQGALFIFPCSLILNKMTHFWTGINKIMEGKECASIAPIFYLLSLLHIL